MDEFDALGEELSDGEEDHPPEDAENAQHDVTVKPEAPPVHTDTLPKPTVPVTTMLSRLAALRIVYGRPTDRDLQAARAQHASARQGAAIAPKRIRLMVRDEDECGKKEIPSWRISTSSSRTLGRFRRHLFEMSGLDAKRVDVRKIFSPRRSAEVASAFDFVPGTGFDLRTGWDLSTPAG